MEAVPRLPMLSFPKKNSSKLTEFGVCLKKHIRDHYHEDPESYNNEISELESLRRSALNASTFVDCSVLKKYYCQLLFLTSRFPMDEMGLKLLFTWNSAFDQNVTENGDINHEMNCILYNLAALHTNLGASEARTSPDGMKISCTHFQCASWAFQVLSESTKGIGDIKPLLMTFMNHLGLSQAQECILEKSMTDNRKPIIIAKISMQVVEYLRQTLKNLENLKKTNADIVSLIGSKPIKVWHRHCDFKIIYYTAVTYFHQGLQSEEQQKMGERISFFQGAVDKLDEAIKFSKNMDKAKAIGETLTFANDVIRGKLTAAQRENEFVYHEKVPPLSSLSEIKGASLVKGIPFSFTDKEVAGQDIFSRLVPMKAHQSSSLYSEEKAKLLRRLTGEIQEKNEELEMYLASMQLDSFAFEENFDFLSQELVDACADLNSRNALRIMNEIMMNINSYYHDLQAKLKDTDALIKQEEGNEKEFCLVMGTKRAPNQILTELKREVIKYKEAHEAALTSNQALHNAITQHKDNILLLSEPLNSLTDSLPSVAGVESEPDKATRMEVQRLLSKIQDMKTQRSDFENKLRMDLQNDDVTKQLVTNQEEVDKFFKEQLGKHSQLVSLLEQNMSAQTNILQALSEANAAYGAMRRTINQIKDQRSATISSLLSSYNAFLNIIEKADEAREFYSKLDSQVNKVSSRVKSFCKVQEEEREERLAANMKKIGGNVKLDSYVGPTTTGPKLKDFLQAGIGAKGLLNDVPNVMGIKSYQTDISNVDLSAKSGFIPGPHPSHPIPGAGYTPSTMRPTPVGSERNDSSQNTYLGSSQYPPSAPVPASGSAPASIPAQASFYTSQQNQTPSYPTMRYYQPNAISNITTTGANIAPITPASSISNVQYPGYNQPYTSSAGYNYSQTPHVAVCANSGVSSNSYQQPISSDHRYNPQNISSNVHYIHPSGGTISLEPKNSNPTTLPSVPNLGPSNQSQPSTPYVYNYPASNASYSSGNYVSQAGVYHTNISSSNQGQNLPSSSEVRNTYFNAPAQSNYAPTTLPLSANVIANTSKYDSYYYSSSKPSSHTSPNIIYSNSNSNSVVSASLNQGNKTSNGTSLYSPSPSVVATHYSSNYSQGIVDSNTNMQGWMTGNSNSYIGNQSNVYNQNIPYSSATTPADIKHQSALPSYKQYYSQNSMPSASSSQYPVQVAHSSVPYSNVQSTASVAYNYNQSYGYAVSNSVQPTYSSQYPPSPHYSAIQTTVATPTPNSYSSQQLPPQQPLQPSQNIQSPAVTSVASQPSTKSNKEGISNLDLLSDIDMSVPSASLWSPLMPQTTSSSTSGSTESACPGPDVTSGVTSTTLEQDISINEISSDLSTSNGVTLESLSVSVNASHVIDLSKLSKPNRSTSVLDPLSNDATLNLLASETERFSKFVQGLDKKSLNGPTNLELKWNELIDALELKCSDLKVSVGRCYPLKNRFPDNLSFDATRVPLPSTRDDYINASFAQLKLVEESIPLIITQAPMPNTFVDFWTMVWENQVEIVVCINTDAEVKNQIYFAKEASESVEFGTFTISLKQARFGVNDSWIQRTLHLTHNTLKTTKVVLHMQFLTWPPSAMPESPGLFLQFIGEIHNLQKQQRNKLNAVIVHCVSGTGRSGVFAVLSSYMKQLQSSGTLADIWNLVIELSHQRRASMQDRTHLMFLYSSALYYAQEVLMKRGILTDKATFEEGPREKTHVRHPSSDLLSSDLSRMKAKLGLDECPSIDNNLSRSGSQSSVVSAESSTGGGGGGCVLPVSSSHPSSVSPSPTHHSVKSAKVGSTELPPNLAASLDPNCLVLSTPNPNKPKKITKENFLVSNQGGVGLGASLASGYLSATDLQNVDPLSGLDPLWNMKKS